MMPIDLQPVLEGKQISLRPLKNDEFEVLYAAASDPLIWEQHPSSTRYQRPVFQKFFDEAIASKGALVILERASGRLIGCSRYYGFDPKRSELVIGYTFLVREFWGGSVNAELKALMMAHAFQYVEHLLFHVGAGNARSRRAMEKIGGVLDEQRGDSVIYRISRPVSRP